MKNELIYAGKSVLTTAVVRRKFYTKSWFKLVGNSIS